MGGRERWCIGGADGNSGSSGNGGNGKREWQGNGRGVVGVGQVMKAEKRRMIGWQRAREPHVVIHLDIER